MCSVAQFLKQFVLCEKALYRMFVEMTVFIVNFILTTALLFSGIRKDPKKSYVPRTVMIGGKVRDYLLLPSS